MLRAFRVFRAFRVLLALVLKVSDRNSVFRVEDCRVSQLGFIGFPKP